MENQEETIINVITNSVDNGIHYNTFPQEDKGKVLYNAYEFGFKIGVALGQNPANGAIKKIDKPKLSKLSLDYIIPAFILTFLVALEINVLGAVSIGLIAASARKGSLYLIDKFVLGDFLKEIVQVY